MVAYTLLRSLLESWLVIFLLFYQPKEELENFFNLSNTNLYQKIPNQKLTNIIKFISDNPNIECHTEFFKKNKTFMMRVQNKRNYIHFINKNFDDFSNTTLDDHFLEFKKLFSQSSFDNNKNYSELKTDIISYDVFMGEIVNNVCRYTYFEHKSKHSH